jgi:hypothetical protein
MKDCIIILFLIFASILLPAEVVPLPGLLKPQTVAVDGSQLFITQGTTIYIYSLTKNKLQAKFGNPGEGPGEFRDDGSGIKLEIKPEEIIVSSRGRLSYFTREGKFKRETQLTDPRRFQFKSLGDKYVGLAMVRENEKIYFVLNLYDSGLHKEKELYKYAHPFFPRTKKINAVDIRVSSSYGYNNKIFLDDSQGRILILNNQGERISTITPTYEEIEVTEAHKKRYLEIWKTSLKMEYKAFKERLKFPAYFSRIRDFQVTDGKIYIVTFKEKQDKNQMFIYSEEGKLLKTVFVPLVETDMLLPHVYNYYTIKQGKLYRLVENVDTEEWNLYISAIE